MRFFVTIQLHYPPPSLRGGKADEAIQFTTLNFGTSQTNTSGLPIDGVKDGWRPQAVTHHGKAW